MKSLFFTLLFILLVNLTGHADPVTLTVTNWSFEIRGDAAGSIISCTGGHGNCSRLTVSGVDSNGTAFSLVAFGDGLAIITGNPQTTLPGTIDFRSGGFQFTYGDLTLSRSNPNYTELVLRGGVHFIPDQMTAAGVSTVIGRTDVGNLLPGGTAEFLTFYNQFSPVVTLSFVNLIGAYNLSYPGLPTLAPPYYIATGNGTTGSGTIQVWNSAAVPEPGTLLLLGSGSLLSGLILRRKKRRNPAE